jgi:Mn2+/Fe2+ NRAMP family transporter
MYFIILTTALTLHRHGITDIETSRQAAEALIPLAGKFAALLFTIGVLAVGFLAIPPVAGSAAYAYAETFGWHQGLNAKFKSARAFYGIVICSIVVGIALDFAKISPVKALFYTAVINGLSRRFCSSAFSWSPPIEKSAQPAKLTSERRLSLHHDFVDIRGCNWDVRVLTAQRRAETSR